MFGGGGMNPRKLEQMMEQMGIDMDELDATEVRISMEDGTQLVFSDPEVTRMDARGEETYQVVGDVETVESGAETPEDAGANPESADEPAIPDADVEIVVERTGASEAEAREAIAAADGDLAAAIASLE
ncbi:MAG: nascent polypeptide-associated complex protein [Halodesulfurarchaeum sp.]